MTHTLRQTDRSINGVILGQGKGGGGGGRDRTTP